MRRQAFAAVARLGVYVRLSPLPRRVDFTAYYFLGVITIVLNSSKTDVAMMAALRRAVRVIPRLSRERFAIPG